MPVWVEIMLWISEAITFPVVLLVLVVTVLFLFSERDRGTSKTFFI